MNIDINIKKIYKEGLTLEEYLLLNLVFHRPEIMIDELSTVEILENLEVKGFIRLIDEDIIIEPKTRELLTIDDAGVLEVIKHFNGLKVSYLNIKRESKCVIEKPSIRSRIKTYGLDTVKAVINLKFDLWHKDLTMRDHLTSIATLMKASNFEGYINRLELHEVDKKTESNVYEVMKDEK